MTFADGGASRRVIGKAESMDGRQESTAKRVWRLMYPFLTYMLVSIVVGAIAGIVIGFDVIARYQTDFAEDAVVRMVNEVMETYYRYYLQIQTAVVGLTLPVLLFFLQRDRVRRLQAGYVELLPDRAPVWMALVAIFGAICSYAGNGMVTLSGLMDAADDYAEIAEVFYQGHILMEIVCLGILTPIMEEIIFRGLMYKQLTEFLSKRNAVLVGALLFGVYHGNLVQMIYGIALGLMMIYVYERFKTLLAPILFHAGANILGILLSETTALSFLYSTAGALYASVIAASFMVIGVVWLIENRGRFMAEGGRPDSADGR